MGPWMMGWDGYGHGLSWGMVMPGFWALLLAGLVLLIVWLVRQQPGAQSSRDVEDRALAILRERYARGEISQKQFDEMSRTLRQDVPASWDGQARITSRATP